MNDQFDYIVIGGGIIGMTLARELAKENLKVAIFDRGRLGMETSWAAGGILSSMRPWFENSDSYALSEQGKKLYPALVDNLIDETGIDPELQQSGMVIIDSEHIKDISQWAAHSGVRLEKYFLENSQLNLPVDSVWLPDICQIRPPRLLAALRESLGKLSVSIHEHHELSDIRVSNNQFQSIQVGSDNYSAGAVIITAGAWSRLLLEKLDIKTDAKPIRGQMLCLKPAQKNVSTMILDNDHYLIPRIDGHILLGSTMEDVGFEKGTTESAKLDLLDWANRICAGLSSTPIIKQWSGLRPATMSGKPWIGPLAEIKDIYVNSGHYRKGILQAPASARLLTDYLLQRPSFMPIENLHPYHAEMGEKASN